MSIYKGCDEMWERFIYDDMSKLVQYKINININISININIVERYGN